MGDSIITRRRYPRFQIGEIVVMTRAARRSGLLGHATRNRARVIATDGRRGIKVQRAGLRSVDSYWSGFWRHLRRGERP